MSVAIRAPWLPGNEPLSAAVTAYIDHSRPAFSRMPVRYSRIPLSARLRMLRVGRSLRTRRSDFPMWPIERRIDEILHRETPPGGYSGHRAALILTHDVDTRAELSQIARVRSLESGLGIASAFGFVPEISWPSEDLARSLVDDGCEVYWHDIGHDGRLPYREMSEIAARFDRVTDSSPWAPPMMTAFRSGQLLMSRALLKVVSERFTIDMSMPDTELDGPYGDVAGCGTTRPFSIEGLIELPLSLAQDVFLRHVYGFTAEQVLAVWTEKLSYVLSVGGVAVLNVHPAWVSPRHPDMFEAYSSFLRAARDLSDLWVTTPNRLVAALGQTPLPEASIGAPDSRLEAWA